MAVNKVIIDNEVKLDLTADTVSENNLLAGATAHNSAGEPITGAVVTAPVDSEISETSENAIQNKAVANALNDKAAASHTHTKSQITDLPAISNPNLLINPDFKINQRGISGTFSDVGKYFVDRWKLVSGSVTINADGTLTLSGSICQPFENAVGADVTASVSVGTAVYDDSTKTFTITGNGDVISWAKLEVGSVATSFLQSEPVLELVKCQRYYLKGNAVIHQTLFSNFLVGTVNFPTEMSKDLPTVTIYSYSGTENAVSYWENRLDAVQNVIVNYNDITCKGFNSIYSENGFDNKVYSFVFTADAEI